MSEICQDCPLWAESKTTSGNYSCNKVPGYNPKNSSKIEVFFVGDSPKDIDIVARHAYSGDTYNVITRTLSTVGIDLDKCYFTNVVKCKCTKSKLPVESQKECKKYFLKELEQYKPKLIVCMGNLASHYFGFTGNTNDVHGSIIDKNEFGIPVISTFHPFAIMKYVSSSPIHVQFISDFHKIKQILDNTISTNKFDVDYFHAETVEQVREIRKILLSTEVFATDTETSGLDYQTSKVLMCSFSASKGIAYTIPWKHPYFFKTPTERQAVYEELKLIYGGPQKKIFHNGKFDVQMLHGNGIEVNNFYFDTMLAHYVLDENSHHDLETVGAMFTDMGSYKDEVMDYIKGKLDIDNTTGLPWVAVREKGKITNKETKRDSTIYDCPIQILQKYSATDSDVTFRVYEALYPLVEKDECLDVLLKIMMPISGILAKMEFRGITLDKEYITKLAFKYENAIKEAKQRVLGSKEVKMFQAKHPDKEFNMNSTDDKRELFYSILKLKPPKVNKVTAKQKDKGIKVGSDSTDADALETLLVKYKLKIFEDFLTYQKVKKFGEYVTQYLKLTDNPGSIAHTSYKQHGTVTARLSSVNPALQTIPKRDPEKAKELRQSFIARPGYTFLEADFSSAEFFVWGLCSQDEKLLSFLYSKDENGNWLDIHKQIACTIFHISIDKVTKEQRDQIKTLVYGLMYGRSVYAISLAFHTSEEAAGVIMNEFFSSFPKATKWIQNQPNIAKEYGYVTSLFGRRRHLPEIYSKDEKKSEEAGRQAMNFPVQSGSADICYIAMIKIARAIENLDAFMILQIHDSIVLEVKDEILDQVTDIVRDCAENCIKNLMRMRVGIDVGKNLGLMEKISDKKIDKTLEIGV